MWMMGVRLGPNANGAGANYANSALRRASVREVIDFLLAQCQIGPRPSTNTDASLGSSRIASQSSYVSMNPFEAGTFAFVHFAGTTSRAHTAPRQATAHRARVSYRPCRAQVTHADIPPSYALGDFDRLKSSGVAWWKAHGPLAPRRSAA